MTDRPLHIRLFRMAVGAVVALALCGIGFATGFLGWMKTLPGEDFASVLLAMMLLFLAAFAFIVSSSAAAYRTFADNYREGDPTDAPVLRTLRVSGFILLMSGVLILAPPVAVRFGFDQGMSIAVAVAMGVLVLIQCWLNLRILRSTDELSRAANADTCIIGFWVTQLGLYGWAALAKLGLVAAPSLWTLMILSMGVYLVIMIGVSIRRGLFA